MTPLLNKGVVIEEVDKMEKMHQYYGGRVFYRGKWIRKWIGGSGESKPGSMGAGSAAGERGDSVRICVREGLGGPHPAIR